MAWDTSYYSQIVLKGPIESVKKVLQKITEPNSGACTGRHASGTRICETNVYDGKYPLGLLGPATLFYNLCDDEQCEVLLHFHPALFEKLWSLLCKAAEPVSVEVLDYRYRIGSLELRCLNATKELQSILNHYADSDEMALEWKSFGGLQPSSFPYGFVTSFQLLDPRIVSTIEKDKLKHAVPAVKKARTSLFTPALDEAAKSCPTEKTMAARKAQADPGQLPAKCETDAPIPMLLFKNSHDAWILLLPWAWVQVFWHCLVESNNVQFGGLNQTRQLNFEAQQLTFPDDWHGTKVGNTLHKEVSEVDKVKWSKKPKSKRISYNALCLDGTKKGEHGNAFICDWNFLLPNLAPFLLSPRASKDLFNKDARAIADMLNQGNAEAQTFDAALISVKVDLKHSGTPANCARIYMIPAEAKKTWLEVGKLSANDDAYPKCPSAEYLIGFVTTGNYNLQQGKSSAIGCLAWSRIKSSPADRDCVVRSTGSTVARLAKWSLCI